MTRKRVRQDLRALLTQHCPTCRGTGVVKSDETLAAEIFRALQAKAAAEAPPGEGREIVARVHPDLAAYLDGDGAATSSGWRRRLRGEDHGAGRGRPGPARGVRAARTLRARAGV